MVLQQGPKGKFAYINFFSTERAQLALKQLNGTALSDGTKLQIRPSYPKIVPTDFNISEET